MYIRWIYGQLNSVSFGSSKQCDLMAPNQWGLALHVVWCDECSRHLHFMLTFACKASHGLSQVGHYVWKIQKKNTGQGLRNSSNPTVDSRMVSTFNNSFLTFVSRHGSVSVATAEESNLSEKQTFTKNDGPLSHDLTIQTRAQVDRDIKQQQFSILTQQFPPFFPVPLVLNNFYFPFSKPPKRIGRNWFTPLFSVGSAKMNKKNNKKTN